MSAPRAAPVEQRRRRTVLRRVLAAVALVLVGSGLWTLAALLSVRDDLEAVQADVGELRSAGDLADLKAPLDDVQVRLDRVDGRLDQPGPRLVAALPLVGRSVSTIQVTTEAARAVTSVSREVLRVAEQEPLLDGGQVRLDRLEELESTLRAGAGSTDVAVARLRAQPLGLVPGAVAGPARTAQSELAVVPPSLLRAASGLRAVRSVLGADGPQSVLVLLENNAELRATGGVVTVFAQARAEDGRLTIESFRDVEDVADPAGAVRTVRAPEDYRALYGPFLANTTLWKNVNMDADVRASSQVIARVASASLGTRPDVVLWLDTPAIAAVLRATGPVRLPDGSTLSAEDVVPRLLSQAYLDAPDDRAGQAERRRALRGAADAVLGSLLGQAQAAPGQAQPLSPAVLGRELYRAAAGRHLALWSADEGAQADLHAAELDGAVQAGPSDLSLFAVHNLGGGDRDGNKLDFYSRRHVDVSVELDDEQALVVQEMTLLNTAPASGLPSYVAGRVTPGVSNQLVTLAVPAGARDVRLQRAGADLAVQLQPSGDHAVVTDTASLPPGTTASWRLSYAMPVTAGTYRLHLVPQPLAVDAGLSVTVTGPEGVRLTSPQLAPGSAGSLVLSVPFDVGRVVDVALERPGRVGRTWQAVRRFWSEPVRVG